MLAVAVLFTGCGSGSGSSLEDAVEATGAETSRVEIVYRFAAADTEKEYEFRGLFDYPNRRGIITTEDSVPFYGEDVGPREFRLIGRTGYVRWVVKGKTYWLKQDAVETSSDPSEVLIPGPGSPTKPTDALTRVLLASDKNEKLGEEEVRGVETTHYRARVDLKKLVKQLPADERPEGDIGMLWGARFVPVDVWIDNESRLRRIVVTHPEAQDRGNPEWTSTVELFDYGVEVDVEPPEGELISEEKLHELTGDSATATVEEAGEAEVCEPPRACQEDKKP